NGNVDGIIPSRLDKDGHPAEARGIVLWPSGNISVMKTLEQVYDPEVFVTEKKAKSKSRKGKKNNKKDKKDKDKDDAKKKK
ncbi:MAG: hypothetical protein IJY53_03665, partial [Akkermansia sp.]|nr:hypothetical protein [Akkermansia sp.]